jgi:hypothetical protein
MNLEDYQDPSNMLEAKKAWENLFENPAWVSLMKALQGQADAMQNAILFGPVSDPSDLYRLEREKGMLEGRLSIGMTAQAMYEEITADLKSAQSDEE